MENGNTTQPNNAQSNNSEQTLSQEQKLNLENLKRIMNSEKTTLPSLRNMDWRTVKMDTNKINQVLIYISMNNVTEINEFWEKIGITSKSTKEKSKPVEEKKHRKMPITHEHGNLR